MAEKRTINIVNMTDTLWQLNRYKVLEQIGKLGGEVPGECEMLVEAAFRFGAMYMEKAIGRKA